MCSSLCVRFRFVFTWSQIVGINYLVLFAGINLRYTYSRKTGRKRSQIHVHGSRYRHARWKVSHTSFRVGSRSRIASYVRCDLVDCVVISDRSNKTLMRTLYFRRVLGGPSRTARYSNLLRVVVG